MEDVTTYIESIPQDKKQDIITLHNLLSKYAPTGEIKMYKEIIGYGNYHYKYASGREGDWFPYGLSSRAQYISVYVIAIKDGQYLAELYKDRLPKANIGKSCVRFKSLSDIDLDTLTQLLDEAKDLPRYT